MQRRTFPIRGTCSEILFPSGGRHPTRGMRDSFRRRLLLWLFLHIVRAAHRNAATLHRSECALLQMLLAPETPCPFEHGAADPAAADVCIGRRRPVCRDGRDADVTVATSKRVARTPVREQP